MGATQTIRPNANRSGSGDFTNTGGGSLYGALSDSSDATYIKKNAVAGTRTYTAELGTYTVAAGYRCKRARSALRVTAPSKAKYLWNCGSAHSPANWAGTATTSTTSGTATRYGPWDQVLTEYYGTSTEITQAVIDAMFLYVTEYYDSGDRSTFLDAWVELDIIDQPTVTVSAGATGTLRPSIAFTYADGDGDVQTKYRVKVFSAAQYGAGGFNAETSTATWDSGELTGSAASVTLTTPLANSTTYKAYVKVAHDGGASDYWSAWTASSAWTTAVTTCTTPTVSGTFDAADGRVTLTVTGAAPPGGVTQTLRVERTLDGGTTWEVVRGWSGHTFDSPYSETVYDYETPIQSIGYRARAVGVNGSGDDVSSPWSATNTETVFVDSEWWLKCVDDPSLNLSSARVLTDPEASLTEQVAVFYPLGASRAVTVSAGLYGAEGTYTVLAVDDDDTTHIAPVKALVEWPGVLMVQSPFGEFRYIRLTSRSYVRRGTADYPRIVWTLGWVEVDRPAVT